MGDRGKELHDFFETLSKAFLEIIVLIIWLENFSANVYK
jgi:hypothetical protein